jgi:metal-responsive CopG/Arc/MetJ family transcriptional regulator
MGRKKIGKENKKPTITILINENLINKIDSIVKDSKDKRSRLIERLLLDYINNKNTN